MIEIKNKGYAQNENGIWYEESSGSVYDHAAILRPDKTLLAGFGLAGGQLVNYFPGSITREDKGLAGDTFFIIVLPFGSPMNDIVVVPIYLLDLSAAQKNELRKVYEVPQKAFVKYQVAVHVEPADEDSIFEAGKIFFAGGDAYDGYV